MGIKGLSKLLGDRAPACRKDQAFENYFGREVAVDASMHIYQFLVVVGRTGDQQLTDETGEVTSHLQGMFYRTVRMLASGMKPIFVFDGKPPTMKRAELAARAGKRGDADAGLAAAKEAGDAEAIEKFSKRTVKVTPVHNEECKRLLRLLGVPVVDAPSEAEAQCAEIVKAGLAYGLASEDMDSLTFGATKVVRNLMKPASQKLPVHEYDYADMLTEMKLTAPQFVDLCILLGCDYCGTLKGIGPHRALDLIHKHGSIEAILEAGGAEFRAKHPPPEPYPFAAARRLFTHPDVTPAPALPPIKWTPADVDGTVAFLVGEKGFDEARVRSALDRISAGKSKAAQGRLESFFGATTVKSSTMAKKPAPAPARKGGVQKGKGGAKPKGKAGGVGRK